MPPADLASKECTSYPGVAAEDLFKHQTLSADARRGWNEYYLRRKVYNAKAAQDSGLLNIDYDSTHLLTGLAARVIKPSGQIVELGKNDFVEAVAAKNNKIKIKSMSLAVPNLEAGDIVEYRWSESADSESYQPQTWFIQSIYPTRLYTFTLKETKSDCTVLWFNVAHATVAKVKGTQVLTVTDLPPYEIEPFTPPERDLRGTVVIVNTGRWARYWGKEDLWRWLSEEWAENFRLTIKPNADITRAAREAIGTATTDEAKVAAIYNYVRREILNLNYFDDASLQAAREKLTSRDNEQIPPATLKSKSGYPYHVNQLFASMCVAAGYQVRTNWSTSRDDTTNIRHAQGFVFLNYNLIAVKVNGAWKYYCPGDYFVSPGMVDWKYENAPGLLCEEKIKTVTFAAPTPAPAADSEVRRTGAFTLTAEGDCEGTVTIAYTGHSAVAKKHEWSGQTREQIEKSVREEIATRLPTAEISEFYCENIGGMAEPTTVSYHMKIAGYADPAGDRLIFAPGIFQKGVGPVFKNANRKWSVAFPHGSHTHDEVSIELPAGYELDSPSAPIPVGRDGDPFRFRYTISVRKRDGRLTYIRDATICDGARLTFAATSYPAIKEVFDSSLNQDAHTLVMKPKDSAATAESPAAHAEKT